MRKELLYAILAGGVLGLVIAFGIWRVNSSISTSNKTVVQVSPTPSVQNGFAVTISKLQNNDVITENPIIVTGLTKGSSMMAVSTSDKDSLIDANAEGVFEKEMTLSGGLNRITFTAIDETGNQAEAKLNLVFSSEFPLQTVAPKEETKESTDGAETIKEKVEKKVEEVLNQPKAYIGTVTDITDSTIQLKNESGEIQQVGTSEETTYLKMGKTTTTIKATDVAIGDYLIAMGYTNGNHVLKAKRILVAQVLVDPNIKVVLANITEIGKKDITARAVKDGKDYKLTITANTLLNKKADGKITKIKLLDLENEDRVIIFFKDSQTAPEARTVFVLK
jgi:hypothetical protein